MNRLPRILSIILLLFTSIGALGGGIFFFIDPSGEAMGLPGSFLENTPFDSFLIPGIILFVMNGLLSLLFAILVIRKSIISGWLVLIQGCILMGWIIIQILMIREYAMLLHTLYLAVGLVLTITGFLMLRGK